MPYCKLVTARPYSVIANTCWKPGLRPGQDIPSHLDLKASKTETMLFKEQNLAQWHGLFYKR